MGDISCLNGADPNYEDEMILSYLDSLGVDAVPCEWSDWNDVLNTYMVFTCVFQIEDGGTDTITYTRDPTQVNLPSSISSMSSLIPASSMISLDPCDAYNGVVDYLFYLTNKTIIKSNQELGNANSNIDEDQQKEDDDGSSSSSGSSFSGFGRST